MAELNWNSPLVQAGFEDRVTSREGPEIRELPRQTLIRLSSLAGAEALNALLADAGVRLPAERNQAAVAGPVTALWLRPTEWLLVSSGQEAETLREVLTQPLPGPPLAITEVSDSLASFRLGGPLGPLVLCQHCGLDLDPDVFGPGDCAQTRLAGVRALLHRHPEGIDVRVDRSVAAYLYLRLVDSIEHAIVLAG